MDPTAVQAQTFATTVVAWQRASGRHNLPWQGTQDPYRVWLSEIMLQQTQVSAVLGYFPRFLARFPTVQTLAAAPLEDVLALWSGLGYYSRARNLHRCAQAVCAQHAGVFPASASALAQLPGIGPSTAAAIAAFCFHERVSIFDGNVQRVLARYTGFEPDLATTAARKALWAQAQRLVPEQPESMPAYTQGLMDLGATVCTPRSPTCASCPLAGQCAGLATGEPVRFPVKSRALRRQTRLWWWLVVSDAAQRVWLEQRPSAGVWAQLHCFPVFESEDQARAALPPALQSQATTQPAFKHVLTHLDLVIHPIHLQWPTTEPTVPPGFSGRWWSHPTQTASLGLPTPVARCLANWA